MSSLTLPFPGNPSANGSFGNRRIKLNGVWINHLHDGTDWPVGYETPLRAMADGKITINTKEKARGYRVGVTHPSGEESGYNLLRWASHLPVGRSVKKGDIIGYSGPHLGWQTDGTAANGPHVHAWYKKPALGFVDMRAHLKYTGFSAAAGAVPFDNTPPPEEKAPNMSLRLIRNSTSGLTVLCSMETGFWYPIPNVPERDLLVAHLKPDPDLYADRPDNEFRLFESLAKLARGDAPAIDTAALVKALAGVLGGNADSAALAAVLDDRIDDIAKAVNDDAARRLQA